MIWKHQFEAIKKAKNHKSFAFFLDTGTGKSRTILELIKNNPFINEKKTLIVCPKIMISTWEREIATWIGDVEWITVTNYEKTPKFQNISYTTVIFDESHKLKNHSTDRYKNCRLLCGKAEYRFILTGTPVLKDIRDLWSQIELIKPKHFSPYNRFVEENFVNMNAHKHWFSFPDWKIRDGRTEFILDQIQPFSYFCKKETCVDLPPIIETKVTFDLHHTYMDMYRELEKYFIVDTAEGMMATPNVVSNMLRLNQICNSVINAKACINKDNDVKFHFIQELIDSTNENIVIFCPFNETIRLLQKRLPKCCVLYDGIDELEKYTTTDARIIIVNPSSGSTGIDLTKASIIVWYGRTWNLEHRLQGIARCYRAGQKRSVSVYDLLYNDTIDPLILDNLENKGQVHDLIFKVGEQWKKRKR